MRMMRDRLLVAGIAGTTVTLICCFTPALAVLIAALGLSAAIGWIDIVLFPTLAIFLIMTGYAIWLRIRKT